MSIDRVFAVSFHLCQCLGDLSVRDGPIGLEIDRVLCGLSFGEDIAVEVDLFKIGEDSLSVLEDRQGCAYFRNVLCGIFRIARIKSAKLIKVLSLILRVIYLF